MNQQIFIELSASEQNIIDLLTEKELHIDLIVESLDWGFSKVANELLQAEFKGLIISLPGKIYKKNIYFFYFLEKYYTFAQNLKIKLLINTNKYGTENP